MKKKNLLLTLVLSLGLAVSYSTVALACGKCKKSSAPAKTCKITKIKEKAKLMWAHRDHLELTDEQLAQIKNIKHQAIKDIIRYTADKDIIYVDIKSEMWEKSINLDKVNDLIDQKYSAKVGIAKTYVKALASMQNILTDEQKDKAHELCVKSQLSGDSACSKSSKCCKSSKCSGCTPGKKCAKCSGGKVCPITGKTLGTDKGSVKGSMK